MESAIRSVISEFERRPMQAARALRGLFENDRTGFFERSLSILRHDADSPGYNYLLTLLLSQGVLARALCDPEVFTLEQAIRIAHNLQHADPKFDVLLLRNLLPNNGKTTAQQLERVADTATGMRLLDVLSEISDGTRIISTMAQLLTHPSSHIRSKAALLVGRCNKSHKWVQDRLEEDDPRVRANAVESLWGSDTPGSRAVFWTALADDNSRVVGNAALGLYRLGEPGSLKVILQLLAHPEARFRATGVWVMGETGDPRFIPMMAKIISEPSAELRGYAFRAMAKLKKAMAKRTGGTPLSVYSGPLHRSKDDWVEFVAAVRGCRGRQIPALNANNFAIWEDSVLCREYTVQPRGKHEPIAIALALPRHLDRMSRSQELQEIAVERALRYKRRCDVWMVLKYISPSRRKRRLLQPLKRWPLAAF